MLGWTAAILNDNEELADMTDRQLVIKDGVI